MVHLTSKKSVIDLILNYGSLLSTDPVYFQMCAVISMHNLQFQSQLLLETKTLLVAETTLTKR